MTHTPKFSTENADYYIVYGEHNTPQNEDIFLPEKIRQLDAIVLEAIKHSAWQEGPLFINQNNMNFPEKQYESIIYNVFHSSKNIPFFIADVDAEYKDLDLESKVAEKIKIGTAAVSGAIIGNLSRMTRRDILRLSILTGFAGYGLVKVPPQMLLKRYSKTNEAITNISQNQPYTECITYRNAIVARKVEEGIAPLFDHRPTIAIIYGAAHSGLHKCLLRKRRRDNLIQEFLNQKNTIIDKKTLDIITELEPLSPPDLFNCTHHKTNLF